MIPNILISNLPYLLKGAVVTLALSAVVVTAGNLLGLLIGIISVSVGRLGRSVITAYIIVLRGVPILVIMLLGYYTFPALGYRVPAYVAVGTAQIIYVSAFVAEIVRSAIYSVPPGQIAAARSLGMRRFTILREILLPQATRIAIPPLLNSSLTAIKQTSYVSVVGVWEVTYAAREVVERTLACFQIFLGVMAIYFVVCYPLSILARWWERRMVVIQ
jgi:His/Glu/Gln/Arg/opine family amino acid ABC transporter permease subunit